jgi:hypothetical protein
MVRVKVKVRVNARVMVRVRVKVMVRVADVVEWYRALDILVLQCINGVSSNPVEGRTKICQLKDLILTLFGLNFRRVYIVKPV